MRRWFAFLMFAVTYTVSISAQNDSLPIRLSAYEIDLGEKAGRAVIDTAVWVRNVSDKPQKYFSYRTSCDCLQILADTVTINPGDSVRFPIKYDIRRYYAQHEYIKHLRLDFGNGIKQFLKVIFYIVKRDADDEE